MVKMKKSNKYNRKEQAGEQEAKGRTYVLALMLLACMAVVFYLYNASANTTPTAAVIRQAAAGAGGNSTSFQEIRMNVSSRGWIPNKFILKTGVPVKWIIDGQQLNGCNSGIQVPALGLRFSIKPGLQTIEFTPNQAGTIQWSCFMNMLQGVFVVKDDVDLSNQQAVDSQLGNIQSPPQGDTCGGGGGGCGCGGGGSLT
jgi:hypothetical protein